MKRTMGMGFAVLLAAFAFACGSDDGDTTIQDLIIVNDVIGDTGTTTDDGNLTDTNIGTDTNTGADANELVDGFTSTDTNVGVDTNVGTDENGGTDTNVGTDEGTNPDVTVPTCIDDPVGSCKAFYECYGLCPDGTAGEACIQECQARLSPDGLEDLQDFQTCLSQYCASASSNEAFYECLEDYCIETYFGCFWGCNYLSCYELIAAINSCPDDDPTTADTDEFSACVGDSWGNTTPEGQLDLQNAIDCSVEACPTCSIENPTSAEEDECDTCYGDSQSTTCQEEWSKCRQHGTEYETCGQITACFSACPDDNLSTVDVDENQECIYDCFYAATLDAQDDRVAAENCSFDACPICEKEDPTAAEITECNTCFNDSTETICKAEWDKCRAEGTDYTTCYEMTNCFNTCPDDDPLTANTDEGQDCIYDCFYASTGDAQDDRIAAENCSFEACPICEKKDPTDAEINECTTCYNNSVDGECADEWAQCLPSPGDDSCSEVLTCMNSCQDQTCLLTCYQGGTETAQDLYSAVEECIFGNCDLEDDTAQAECISAVQQEGGECYDELGACNADA